MDVLIGIVTGAEVKINRDGTVPGRLCQAVITDPEDVQTIEMTGGSDEFHPPNGCRLLILEAGPDCKMVVGVDDGVAPVMEAGGKRIYSLNTGGEKVMAEVQLQPDGRIIIKNDAVSLTLDPDGKTTLVNGGGSFTMDPGGNFTFHGASSTFDHPVTMQSTLAVTGAITASSTIKASGTITAPTVVGSTDVTFGGKSGIGHKHGAVQNGTGTSGAAI